jgi:hypothetical protein
MSVQLLLLSLKFSGGLFGEGVYLAENPTKNDQYCVSDSSDSSLAELHNALYSEATHPGKVYYVLLCRVVMGQYVKTKDGATNLDTGGTVWAVRNKELSEIKGTKPPILYHSLLAEIGGKVQRHREFLQYHKVRVYPAYLLAYERHKDGQKL